jgi:chromosome segregation ATPase
MEAQYRSQLNRIVDFVVYREGDVANALSLMSEVQGKLDEVTQTIDHLAMISRKATAELEVLVLTKRVADARSQLAKLQDRQQELSARLSRMSGAGEQPSELAAEADKSSSDSARLDEIRAIHEEIDREISRLNDLITDASEKAAKTVQKEGREKKT